MSCDRIEELLTAYKDGGLDGAERALVEAHLKTCRECSSLLAFLGEADAALASFPEVEPGSELRDRLSAIAVPKPRFSVFTWLRRPALQPILAAATVLCAAGSLYLLSPNRREFDKAVVRTFHRGVGRIEKLYAEAGSITGKIGSYAENLYDSIQAINPLDRGKD